MNIDTLIYGIINYKDNFYGIINYKDNSATIKRQLFHQNNRHTEKKEFFL